MKTIEITREKESVILSEMIEKIRASRFVAEKTIIVCVSKSNSASHAHAISHAVSFDGIPLPVVFKEIPETSTKKVQSLNIGGLFNTLFDFERFIILYPGHLQTSNAFNAMMRVKEFLEKSVVSRNTMLVTVLENEKWPIKAHVSGRSFDFDTHGKPYFWWENKTNPYRFTEEDTFN